MTDVYILAQGTAHIEIRNSRIAGYLIAQDHARATVQDTTPPNETAEFSVSADGDSQIVVTRSYLRSGRSTATRGAARGADNGVVEVTDSTLEGVEDDAHSEWAIYAFGSARVRVRGGDLIGQAQLSVKDLAEVKPARWTSPLFGIHKTLVLLRCLSTADIWIRGSAR